MGQRLSDGGGVTRGTVQPSKLRMTKSESTKKAEGKEAERVRVPSGDTGHSRNAKILMHACLLVYAPLSLSSLLIPGFIDVKSLFHLFPCQLCSHSPQPSDNFRFR